MITLEQLIVEKITVPITYGWTNDYAQTMNRIANIKSNSIIEVVLQGIGSFRIAQGKITPGAFIQDPSFESMMATITNVAALAQCSNKIYIHMGISPAIQIPPTYKIFYDKCLEYIYRNQVNISNLISNTEMIDRNKNVEEYEPNRNNNIIYPKLIILGSSSKMPTNLSNFSFDIGCIDISNHSKNPLTSGLNVSETQYIEQMYNVLKPDEKQKANVIAKLRKGIFSGSSVIRDIPIINDVSNIGGYEKVKEYYEFRKKYVAKEKGIIKIKGDLFVGPPGTGKSVIMTAIPSMLGLPGFQLDINAGLGSLQGQSEQAIIDALEKARKLAPCVILVDEIEKTLSGTGEGQVAGNEVAEKILGILLTAMAEKNGIYWIASANRIDHIQSSHPELLRKGRFDNMWYVPLPNKEARAKIFGIHSRINGIDGKKLMTDIEKLVNNTEGWSGAEIEHVCKEAYVSALATGKEPDADFILTEIANTTGLSANQKLIEKLDSWAKGNARMVD